MMLDVNHVYKTFHPGTINERPALVQLTVLTVSLVILLLFGIFRAGYISSEFIYKQF